MKTNIAYIAQVDGQNILQVHYKSGVDRYIEPNGWGLYEPNMAQTQIDFMKAATVKRYSIRPLFIGGDWNEYVTHWEVQEG